MSITRLGLIGISRGAYGPFTKIPLDLGTCDVGAIAQAVYDKFVSEGLVLKIDELYLLQGLSVGDPMTVTQTARAVAGISQTISGDGTNTSTVERN